MSDTETSRTLLAQLAWRFHPRMEELAVAALAFILNRYPDSRRGLNELLNRAVPGMRSSGKPFETEAPDPELGRPDILQKGDDEEARLLIEAKFFAPLMPAQPVAYLKQLPPDGVSVLMFLARSGRLEELWPELLGRLNRERIPYSDLQQPRCVRIGGTDKHLSITDWMTLLDSLKEPLEGHELGLADLRQLRGLVRFAEARESKARRPGKELVQRVAEIGKMSGWLNTKRRGGPGQLMPAARSYGYGRYARLGRRYKLGVWLGIHSALHEEFALTPLWVHFEKWSDDDREDWNERVSATLKDRMSPYVKQVGKTLWVGVVPEGGAGADSYAAALERIAGILDELADPWHSRASVLAEVSRRYQHPVMSNAHRSEYVEALVALALRDSDWARKAPWEAWQFEHESGVRLKLKHSAAVQSWGNGETQSSPRFSIAPVKQYWDEEEGRFVEYDGRPAEIYVFAWHGAPQETADQADPSSWEFYVVAERDLPKQKSIALKALQDLTSPCGIGELAAAVDGTAVPTA